MADWSLQPVDHDPFNGAGPMLVPVDHDPFATPKPGMTVPPADVGQAAARLPGQFAQGAWNASGLGDVYDTIRRGGTWTDVAGAAVPLAMGVMAGPEEKAAELAAPTLERSIASLGGNWGSVPVMDHMGNVIRNPLSGGQNVGGPILRLNPDGTLTKGIVAYHGSPYDFDKFDLSKVGTGEGAQAYGHGLYFAESPGVAESYKKNLAAASADVAPAWNGSGWQVTTRDGANYGREFFPSQEEAQAYAAKFNKGKMYQVSIAADPEHFLDWDKPLSEQSPQVKAALQKAGVGNEQQNVGTMYNYLGQRNMPPDTQYPGDWRGESNASDILRQAGIPGIKYLDQGSRPPRSLADTKDSIAYYTDQVSKNPNDQFSKDQLAQYQADLDKYQKGTHNYVVFDDNLINIIRKYGIAGLIAGGAAHFSTTPVDHDPYAQ